VALGLDAVIALLAVAVVAIVAFFQVELRSAAPMVNFSFFRSRTFLGANVVGLIVSFAMLAQFFFLALYMQNILKYSPLQTGGALPAVHRRHHRDGSAGRGA